MMAAKEQEKERARSKARKAKDQENTKKKSTTKCPSFCSAATFGNSTLTLRSTSVFPKQRMEHSRSEEQT